MDDGRTTERPNQRLEQFVQIKWSDGEIVAFLVARYDNLIVIAGAKQVRHNLVEIATAVMKDFSLRWKRNDQGEPWTLSNNEVSYLRIHFHANRKGEIGLWRHADKQIPRWKGPFQPLRGALTLKARDLAAVLGVILWDLQVSGLPRAAVAGLVELARRLGVQGVFLVRDGQHLEG